MTFYRNVYLDYGGPLVGILNHKTRSDADKQAAKEMGRRIYCIRVTTRE